MNKSTSIYLDLVRFLAALAVFLTHLNDWCGKQVGFFTPTIATQAVIVFFLLSGFVIAYVTEKREDDWVKYASSRMGRIYSVAIPALLITFFADSVSSPLPNIHEENLTGATGITQFFSGILFLNEVWGRHIPIGTNIPYWSLGYEVPYYVCFGILLFAKNSWRWLALIVLIAYGPRIFIFSTIWLMGFASYYICRNKIVQMRLGLALFLGSIIIWPAFNSFSNWTETPLYWHTLRDLPGDFVVAILFSLNIIGLDALTRSRNITSARIDKIIRRLAGTTFSLYLFHIPIAQITNQFMPFSIYDPSGIIFIISIVFLVAFILAVVTEKQKILIQIAAYNVLRSSFRTSSAMRNP